MRYIENDGQVTREYDVKINVEELEDIIHKLDAKCYRIVNKSIKVAADNRNQAIEKIGMAMNTEGNQVNELIGISDGYKDLVDYSGSMFVYDCLCICKQSPSLVTILSRILDNYRAEVDFKKQNNRLIDFLIEYEQSDELVPYDERILLCTDIAKVNAIYQEERHNKNYDFKLLKDLYQRAKDCFELTLVAETIHYKDLDKNPKVYKLGAKRNI